MRIYSLLFALYSIRNKRRLALTIAQLKVVNAHAPGFVLLLALLRILDASEQSIPFLFFGFNIRQTPQLAEKPEYHIAVRYHPKHSEQALT